MRDYKEYLESKRAEYGAKFDPANLASQFIPYFENGQRIEVEFVNQGKVYEKKRGTVGVTTGWKPCFLLMLTNRSIGSMYTLSKKDRVVKVIR